MNMVEFCCGDPYTHTVARLALGESWHPGGLELTGRLSYRLGIVSKEVVLDIACGVGNSASFISKQFGCNVIGLDRSQDCILEATRRQVSGVCHAQFAVSDSQCLPLADSSVDKAIMECVLSTFPDKELAIHEVARVLKRGGRVGITDVVVNGELPPELRGAWLQPFCLSGALSESGYRKLVEDSGFDEIAFEDRTQDGMEFVEIIRKKLLLARVLSQVGKLSVDSADLKVASRILVMANRSMREGRLGYGMLVASKQGT